jgi:aspartyl-tRNA(Asn)/glutamyl-tRNA(Gln) amidotransferase subunit C
MVTKKEVKHIAGLARIGMDDKDVDKFTQDLSAVLDWVDELKKVDIQGVEPTAHITGLENMAREDKTEVFISRDKIIRMFPEEKDGFDKVKSVM